MDKRQDISIGKEQKPVEERLRELEERYGDILRGIEDGYYEVDVAGNFTFFNDSMCRIFGYPRDELMGMNNRQYSDKETARRVFKTFNKVYRTGEPTRGFDWEIIRKDGSKRYIETSVTLMKDAEGRRIGLKGIVRDVTERKEAEKALQESEERFRDISYSMADWIWEVDNNGKFTFASGQVKEILGYDSEELIGKTPFDLMPENEAKCIGEVLKKIASEKKPIVDLENWNLSKEGREVCLLTNGVPILDEIGRLTGYRGVDKDITKQKLAEEEIKKRHDLETKLIQSSIDGIIGVDTKGNITLFSKAAEKIFGYSQNEVEGKINIEELYPPGYARDVNNKLKGHEYGGTGLLINYETEVLNKDGRHIPVRISGSILYDNSKVIGSVGYFHDITLRKQMMEQLRQSEEKYRTIFQDSMDAIYINTREGEFIDVNQSMLDLFGYTREEMIGLNAREIHVTANDQPIILNEIDRKGFFRDKEVKFKKKDGRVMDCLLTATVRRADDGSIIGYQGIIRDITERKQAEEALRRSEERYRNILESIEDGYYEVDVAGNFTFFNDSMCRIFGYPRDELMGMNNRQYSDKETARRVFKTFNKVYRTGEPTRGFDWEIIRKDGARTHIEGSISLVRDSKGHGIGFRGIVRDVTDRKLAEEALRKAKADAECADRAKSEFLANMSHEIRTPMNGIIGMTDLALGTELTREQREYLEMVKTSAESLLGLVNDILDFSKIEAGKLEMEEIDFDLRNTLENTADTLALKAQEKGLELTCHIRPEVPTALRGDPGRLRQIIMNLAGNSIKFTEKGEVVIRVEPEEEAGDWVRLHFSVSDTGLGIPPDKLDSIFNSFEQVDGSTTRKYGGTGLGLSISKQLVEMMGGKIWVESPAAGNSKLETGNLEQAGQALNHSTNNHGPGSTFHFTVRFGLSRAGAVRPLGVEHMDLSGMPVLIIDDNYTNRVVLQEMTALWGLVPTVVAGGKEGLARLAGAFDSKAPYRLVLLDLQMPGMDGFEVAKRIKAAPFGKDVDIIVLTSIGQKGDAARCREMGISGYLKKPIKQSELLDAIMIALGHSAGEAREVITRHTIHEARARLRIVLAEDNLINQKLATKLLETRGHDVTLASNGREAVEAFSRGHFDLILMDVQMPEMDGFDATREIRKLENGNSKLVDKGPGSQAPSLQSPVSSHIPIIAMTAHAMTRDRERCLAAGMDDYISKPIKPEGLFRVIEKWGKGYRRKPEGPVIPFADGEPVPADIFDRARALEVVGGDEDLLREIAGLFLEELPGSLAMIRAAIEAGDTTALEEAAHSLKGSVGNFGAKRAHEAAYGLEVIGKEGRLSEAAEALSRLEAALQGLEIVMKKTIVGEGP